MGRTWVGAIKFGVRIYNDRIYSNDLQFNTLIINGHIKHLNAGVTNLSGKGTVIKAGNKLTFSTNDGEAVDFISFGTFMNIYVRSNVEKVSGICSQQFIRSKFFNHVQIGKLVKIKTPKCDHKKKFKKMCIRRKLRNGALRQCISDFCNGLEKKIEEKIININKEEKELKKIVIKRVSRITCSLYADPHVHGFNNRYYNAQTVGDWVLYRGVHLSAHYRGVKMGSWVGAVKFGVRLYGDRITSNDLTFNSIRINGEVQTLTNGVRKISRKGSVIKAGNKLTFSTNDGEEVDFITFGSFMNVYVRSNVDTVHGICSQQFIKSKFFKHSQKGKIVEIETEKCPNREKYTISCKKRGLRRGALRQCIQDLCNGLSKEIENKMIKINHNEKIEHIRIKPRKIVSRVQCSLYADPHVTGFNNRNYNAQTVGDWVLYRGENLSAHYRGIRMGSWVGAVKFGVRLYGDRITSHDLSFNSIIINGQFQNLSDGKTKISERGSVTKAGNKLTFSTNDGEEVDFITYGTFMNVYVRSNVEIVHGICSQEFIHSTFFNNEQVGNLIQFGENNCANRHRFKRRCIRRGLIFGAIRNCVIDLCNGLNIKIERQILRGNKREGELKIHHRRHHHHHHHHHDLFDRIRHIEAARREFRLPHFEAPRREFRLPHIEAPRREFIPRAFIRRRK